LICKKNYAAGDELSANKPKGDFARHSTFGLTGQKKGDPGTKKLRGQGVHDKETGFREAAESNSRGCLGGDERNAKKKVKGMEILSACPNGSRCVPVGRRNLKGKVKKGGKGWGGTRVKNVTTKKIPRERGGKIKKKDFLPNAPDGVVSPCRTRF